MDIKWPTKEEAKILLDKMNYNIMIEHEGKKLWRFQLIAIVDGWTPPVEENP